ncbi:MAG: insulinase family protein [Candidatus Pacebacteria bacterium]|nr:insulinase family protein [Candidatus Paceibacterota bacterium]
MKKNFTRIVLENGMRVILTPNKQSLATTVLVLVEAGSKYETKNISGLSHFLEHMCFKGTTKRPTAMDISGELDGMGAEYNAFTSHEWTGYYAKVQPHKAKQALDLIADMYLNPVFDEKEIEKEKGVIIEELNMYEDTPMRKVGDLFTQLLYGDQPAGWDIGGNKEIIRILNKENFVKYRNLHYVGQSTTVVVAGNFKEKEFLGLIKKNFKSLKKGEKGGKLKVVESQKNPEIKIQFKESDQSHLIVGVRAFDMYDKRKYALDVLSDILGGGMSSILFQKIRDKMGAAYYVRSSIDLFTDHGFLSVAAGVENSKLELVVSAILEEFIKLKSKLVSEKDLKRSKDHLTGRFLLGLEGSDSLANYYGGQEVSREKILTPEEIIAKIKKVKASEILEVAKFIFQNEKLNLSLIGPVKDGTSLKNILKI